ncbi:MAG: hypothetical protein AAF541_16410 [Pseudomonadota bacterium]
MRNISQKTHLGDRRIIGDRRRRERSISFAERRLQDRRATPVAAFIWENQLRPGGL